MNRIIIITLTFVVCSVNSLFAQTLTLSKAIETALSNNDKIKQYSQKVEQKRIAVSESKGNFLPAINLSAGYNHMNDNLSIDLEPIRQALIKIQSGNMVEFSNVYNLLQGGSGLTQQQRSALNSQYSGLLNKQIPLFIDVVKRQDYWTTTISAAQPLFLGGKLFSAKNIAVNDLEISEIELEKTKNDVTSEVINNYLSIVLLNNLISVRQNVYHGMLKHRNDAKRIYEEGLIAKNQFLRSEVALADAERNLSDEENRLKIAFIALRTSLGIKDNVPIEIFDTLVFKQFKDSISYLKLTAASNHPLLKTIDKKKEQLEDKYKIERSEFLPKVFLFGKYEFLDEYLSVLEPRWIVGIQGSINLFNGFKDKNKLQQTKHQSKEIEFLESDTKDKIFLLLDKNYKDMLNSKFRYDKLEANINLAEENLRLTAGRFESGLCTSLDVIDAELVLEKNLVERKLSLYEYYRCINEIYNTTGNPNNFLKIWSCIL